jgi:hypothetical protein
MRHKTRQDKTRQHSITQHTMLTDTLTRQDKICTRKTRLDNIGSGKTTHGATQDIILDQVDKTRRDNT